MEQANWNIRKVSQHLPHVHEVILTCFSRTGDGFGILGLDGGTGRSEETGAFGQRSMLLADRLQEDFILAGEEEAAQADEVRLRHTKNR